MVVLSFYPSIGLPHRVELMDKETEEQSLKHRKKNRSCVKTGFWFSPFSL
ncbi:hypothetical protein HMPREF1990_00057 [Porphyromonas gingivalis W4087]|nr:hypothetical protein HMPREF1554_00981 [Porphyromonas gingivalis F0569]ERJ91378.1 hypothetical protein HMPREF1990_00057 [Porphyromonas gingivalis W4087]